MALLTVLPQEALSPPLLLVGVACREVFLPVAADRGLSGKCAEILL